MVRSAMELGEGRTETVWSAAAFMVYPQNSTAEAHCAFLGLNFQFILHALCRSLLAQVQSWSSVVPWRQKSSIILRLPSRPKSRSRELMLRLSPELSSPMAALWRLNLPQGTRNER